MRQVEQLVAELSPQPAAPAVIRKLTERVRTADPLRPNSLLPSNLLPLPGTGLAAGPQPDTGDASTLPSTQAPAGGLVTTASSQEELVSRRADEHVLPSHSLCRSTRGLGARRWPVPVRRRARTPLRRYPSARVSPSTPLRIRRRPDGRQHLPDVPHPQPLPGRARLWPAAPRSGWRTDATERGRTAGPTRAPVPLGGARTDTTSLRVCADHLSRHSNPRPSPSRLAPTSGTRTAACQATASFASGSRSTGSTQRQAVAPRPAISGRPAAAGLAS